MNDIKLYARSVPDLHSRRLSASLASGGISSDPIHQMALRSLGGAGAGGVALDFGAGQGGFCGRLLGSKSFASVTGADLMPRPTTLAAGIGWLQADLNQSLPIADQSFDTIAALEVIEHLENPRQFFRECRRLLRRGGLLLVTTPNCESLRSLVSLVWRGHFAAFGNDSYPAHITPLLLIDLHRASREAGLEPLDVSYSDHGAVPGFTHHTWQKLTRGRLKGRRFSDNYAVLLRRSD